MALNRAKMSGPEMERRGTEARVPLRSVCEVYRQQLRTGRHLLHERPGSARSRAGEQAVARLKGPAVGSIVGHQCKYGQGAPTGGGGWLPARKATRWMSSAPEVLMGLGHKCRWGTATSR